MTTFIASSCPHPNTLNLNLNPAKCRGENFLILIHRDGKWTCGSVKGLVAGSHGHIQGSGFRVQVQVQVQSVWVRTTAGDKCGHRFL